MGVRLLLLKAACLIGLVLLTCLLIFSLPLPSDHYVAAIRDKHEALSRARSPKLVFVGGSSLAFGQDSPTIQSRLGLDVVNMGLQAGIGLNYILHEVRPSIQAGDVVVISTEYQHFYSGLYGERELFYALRYRPQALPEILSPGQARAILLNFPTFAQARVWSLASALRGGGAGGDPVYRREGFNAHGDLVAHLRRESGVVTSSPLFLGSPADYRIDAAALESVQDFQEFAERRGARVFVVFPPIPEPHYQDWKPVVDAVDRGLRDSGRLTLLNRPSDAVLPAEYFFDTPYHLNARGRAIRTRYVSDLLEAAVGERRLSHASGAGAS